MSYLNRAVSIMAFGLASCGDPIPPEPHSPPPPSTVAPTQRPLDTSLVAPSPQEPPQVNTVEVVLPSNFNNLPLREAAAQLYRLGPNGPDRVISPEEIAFLREHPAVAGLASATPASGNTTLRLLGSFRYGNSGSSVTVDDVKYDFIAELIPPSALRRSEALRLAIASLPPSQARIHLDRLRRFMSTHEGVPWAAELPLSAGAAAVEALPRGDLQQAVGWASIIVAAGFFIMGDLPNIGHHISPPRPVGLGATGTFFSRYLGPTSGYTVSSRNIQFHFGVIPNGRREALPYGSRIDLWDVCSWLEVRAESTAQEPGR